MKIPICIGMQRSASRLTWHIVKGLAPDEPPESYYPELVANLVEGELMWPIRGHEYLPEAPVVYTYRNPVEAYLSLRSRFHQDVGKLIPSATNEVKTVMGEQVNVIDTENKVIMTEQNADYQAMLAVGIHWNIWKRFKNDADNGRDVLFLKYEDYFSNRNARICDIADFMEVGFHPKKFADIFEYTSLEKNEARGKDPRFEENEEVTFSHGYLEESGMQKGHINPNTRGVPGAYLQAYPKFVNSVRAGIRPAFEALKEMTLDMGYEL